jgi:hypothetical protein
VAEGGAIRPARAHGHVGPHSGQRSAMVRGTWNRRFERVGTLGVTVRDLFHRACFDPCRGTGLVPTVPAVA